MPRRAHERMCDCMHYARLAYGTREVGAPHAQKSAGCDHPGHHDGDLARRADTCGVATRQQRGLGQAALLCMQQREPQIHQLKSLN